MNYELITMNFSKKTLYILLILFTSVGIFFRLYNLNWGAPFYFHPDERNIASVVAQPISIQTITSSTFAYGNFLIILASVIKQVLGQGFILFHVLDPFVQAILVLRVLSFLASVATVLFLYGVGKFWSTQTALIASFLGLFSVGFIQQGHFGTFDMFITLCAVASWYFVLCYKKTHHSIWYYNTLIALAVGASAKLTLLILFILPIGIVLLEKKYLWTKVKQLVMGSVVSIILVVALSPYYLTHDFVSGIMYEQGVVSGKLPVFYTQSFTNTQPILFQLFHIYPFLLNPVIELCFIIAFFYLSYTGIQKKNYFFLILVSFFLFLFIPQAFLFAKWTRYMLPTLPFIYVGTAIFFDMIYRSFAKIHSYRLIGVLIIFLIGGFSFFWSYAYVTTAFFQPDTRITAANWIKQSLAPQAVLTERYDIGILPFTINSENIVDFDFYDLDNNPELIQQLAENLTTTTIIILPSQRLYRSRLLDPSVFPQGNAFYKALGNGALGFRKIYQTPCDAWCNLVYLGNPVFSYEETASVFDRPTVMIFQKTKSFSETHYQQLFSTSL